MISDHPARSYSRYQSKSVAELFLRLSLITEFDDATKKKGKKKRIGKERIREIRSCCGLLTRVGRWFNQIDSVR